MVARLIVPAGNLPRDPLDIVLTRLHESHDLSAYEAVERLVQAGEAAGFDTDALLGMLDRGFDFEKLLELIATKSEVLAEDRVAARQRRTRGIDRIVRAA